MKQFDIVTIFPELIEQATAYGILRRGIEQGAIAVRPHDLRDYTHDRHRQVDDTPYGGGPGMVMKPEPFFEGVEGLQASSSPRGHVVLLSPQGHVLTQARAQALSEHERLIVICPRYEGVDERVRDELVDEELSIGDYVLSGAEFAALVVIDAVASVVSGRPRQQALSRSGVSLRRSAGVPAVHAAGGVPRSVCTFCVGRWAP